MGKAINSRASQPMANLLSAGFLVFVLAGCGARTSVTGAWQEGKPTGVAYRHVLVVGVTPNSRVRRSFELALADAVESGTTRATASIQTKESAPQLSPEIVNRMAQATGADAVLITRVVSRKVSASESESRVRVKTQQPSNLNGGTGLVELFSLEYHEYEEPGEMTAKSTAVLETSVYEATGTARLVYTLTVTSKFREDRDDVVGDVAKAIAGQLRREGLIR